MSSSELPEEMTGEDLALSLPPLQYMQYTQVTARLARE